MDVVRHYYEDLEEFLRSLGSNNHRRRHLPFWNLALSALAASEAQDSTTSTFSPSTPLNNQISPDSSSPFRSAMGGGVQNAITESISTVSLSQRKSTGRVVYITFHAPSPTTSSANNTSILNAALAASATKDDNNNGIVAAALFTSSLIVIFCAHDNLDEHVASWVYAEISAAHRNRGTLSVMSSQSNTTQANSTIFKLLPQSSQTTPVGPSFHTSLPPSIKPLKFNETVSLYGSLAHVRALLDLASASARESKVRAGPSNLTSLATPSRMLPLEYRLSRDDSGMRVLSREARISTRPQAAEFAFGPTLFRRRVRNAFRLFFIAPERLELIDKLNSEFLNKDHSNGATTPNISPSPTTTKKSRNMDPTKCMRLATVQDWEPLKAILRREVIDPDDPPNSPLDEEEFDFDKTLEAVQKGNVYLWEKRSKSKKNNESTPTFKTKIQCFVVVEFHTRNLPELSCVELVDLHVNNPKRDTDAARLLTEHLCRKFLSPTVGSPPPYHFLFVKVDISVPESSDQFLLDCGFIADSVSDFVTLESVQAKERRLAQQQPFEITRVVKISPLTEKPFTAYEIRVSETNELVRKRYREFDKLYSQLKSHFPGQNVPKLPKKKFFGNMDDEFVEKRRSLLQTWLNCVAQLPGVEESGWVANFLWTELKIRGVKGISEEERLFRTLQRQAEETKVNITKTAAPVMTSPRPTQNSSSAVAQSYQHPIPTKNATSSTSESKKEKKSRRLSQ